MKNQLNKSDQEFKFEKSRIFYKQFIEIAKKNARNIPNDFCLGVDIQQVSQSNVYDNNKI